MKKRLLALALCLVMMTSLLPLTAAAYTDADVVNWVNGITDNGTYCKEASFTIDCPEGYNVSVEVDKDGDGSSDLIISPVGEQYKISGHLGPINVVVILHEGANHSPVSANLFITINDDHTDNNADHNCDVCNGCIHGWNFKAAGNTLTGHCPFCGKDVTLTLKADSVTLPTSPFNARLEGWEQFHDAIPTARYEKLVYKYNGPNGWTEVEPIAANAKAGEYQVGVRISGLPNKEYGPVAMSLDDEVIPDGAGYADLYVQYTAADPKVTAQTGDNRPIELMMAGILVFSALAAAAFVLDGKRKYRQ